MKTAAEVIGVSRSNLAERRQERPPKRWVARHCRTDSLWQRSRR
jgi:hypothetical protein